MDTASGTSTGSARIARLAASSSPLPQVVLSASDGLGVPEHCVPSTYGTLGHLGSAGLVANLLEGRRRGLLRDRAAQEELVRDRRNEASLYRPPVHDARHRRSGPSASEEQRHQRT